jgi:hypothetical protein
MSENLMKLPRSRGKAQAQYSKYYFTAQICKNDHLSKRLTSSGVCMECREVYDKLYLIRNAERIKARLKANREKRRLYSLEHYYKNKDEINAQRVAYTRLRKFKIESRFFQKSIYKEDVKEIYLIVRRINKISSKKYSVDHIVPLNGKRVCGLHVPWNLRIITMEENRNKRNQMFMRPMEIESYWDLKINGKLNLFIQNIYNSIAQL